MGTILDGKAVAQAVRAEAARAVELLRARGVIPGLATVLVGDDPASRVYVDSKERACTEIGMRSVGQRLPADTRTADLVARVRELNARPDVHGILVQLPLPDAADTDAVIQAIAPEKDVDGLTAISQGRLLAGLPGLRPCTPLGIMRLLRETGVGLAGATAVVIGRSLLVGKPVALLLLEQHATVTMCHSRTRDLAAAVGAADIVVAAVGRPEMIRGDWIKKGAIVIDVGINRAATGGLVGDVEFARARERAAWITPVPGGVGPMTVAMLLANTAAAAAATTRVAA
ncbi:MAG: bifunctional methylenetetrahydrofolate dehydrogenase/methenyltetrahydrofolate cyclohydrolase FolD [Deltaproteobacteria bacterium]|nr:bifunctional methylenetetrahydrofolate dehydrogenase/methenyltetrahydrofolate cyclohydrolase FolD [Deltaproteobacteria bacterium]